MEIYYGRKIVDRLEISGRELDCSFCVTKILLRIDACNCILALICVLFAWFRFGLSSVRFGLPRYNKGTFKRFFFSSFILRAKESRTSKIVLLASGVERLFFVIAYLFIDRIQLIYIFFFNLHHSFLFLQKFTEIAFKLRKKREKYHDERTKEMKWNEKNNCSIESGQQTVQKLKNWKEKRKNTEIKRNKTSK